MLSMAKRSVSRCASPALRRPPPKTTGHPASRRNSGSGCGLWGANDGRFRENRSDASKPRARGGDRRNDDGQAERQDPDRARKEVRTTHERQARNKMGTAPLLLPVNEQPEPSRAQQQRSEQRDGGLVHTRLIGSPPASPKRLGCASRHGPTRTLAPPPSRPAHPARRRNSGSGCGLGGGEGGTPCVPRASPRIPNTVRQREPPTPASRRNSGSGCGLGGGEGGTKITNRWTTDKP